VGDLGGISGVARREKGDSQAGANRHKKKAASRKKGGYTKKEGTHPWKKKGFQ